MSYTLDVRKSPLVSLLLFAACGPGSPSPGEGNEVETAAKPAIELAQGQTLADVAGDPVPEGTPILVTLEGVTVEGTQVSKAEHGLIKTDNPGGHTIKVIQEALEPLAKAGGARPRLLMAIDERVQTDTLLHVMFNAGKAGFQRFSVVTRPGGGQLRHVPLGPPSLAEDDTDRARWVSLQLTVSSVDLRSHGPGVNERPRVLEPVALDDLEGYVRGFEELAPDGRTLVVSATNDVTIGTLLSVLVAARGQGCESQRTDDCHLDDILIVPERAHEFDPNPKPKSKPPEHPPEVPPPSEPDPDAAPEHPPAP